MNLDRVTVELAYDLVQREVWTVAEFQEWCIFKRKEADLLQSTSPREDKRKPRECLETNSQDGQDCSSL